MVGTCPPGAQVSALLTWDEINTLHPDELTIKSVPERLAAEGDPWEEMNEQPQSLEPLLELHAQDRAAGLSRRAMAAGLSGNSRTSRRESLPAGLARTPSSRRARAFTLRRRGRRTDAARLPAL